MKSNHLEIFCTLMVSGTMTRTSELLGMTQPAVSLAIAALEREVGFDLFQRRRGRLVPTEEANYLYAYASQSIDLLKRTRIAATQIRQGRLGALRIAAYPSISVSFIPELLTIFRRDYPGVEIQLITRSSHVIRDPAAARQSDITISELPVAHSRMPIEVVRLDCVCMMPPDHPLATKTVITPSDLDGVAFVSILREHMLTPQITAAFNAAKSQRAVVAEVEYFISAAAMIASGDCVGIIDPITARSFAAKVAVRSFRPRIVYEFGIMVPNVASPSIPARNFLELLRNELAAVRSFSRNPSDVC